MPDVCHWITRLHRNTRYTDCGRVYEVPNTDNGGAYSNVISLDERKGKPGSRANRSVDFIFCPYCARELVEQRQAPVSALAQLPA